MSTSVLHQSSRSRIGVSKAVLICAALGLLQILLAVYCVVRWYAAGQMTPTPPGVDTMSLPDNVVMWLLQVGGVAVAIWAIWHFAVRPWRRDGRLSGDGLLVIACFLVAIPHDLLLPFTNPSFSYNSHYLNAGSWLSQLPGIRTPNAHRIPAPLLLEVPGWAWVVFFAAILGSAIMRTVHRRWPAIPYFGLIAITFLMLLPLDFAFEAAIVRLRVMAFTGVVHGLTLWPGGPYQLPIYEPVLWVVFLTGMSALRYSRNDRGLTFAERGIDSLRLPTGYGVGIRLLALVGAVTAAVTLCYNLPWELVATQDDSFPAHMPSYMLNGVCTPQPTAATPELPLCLGHRT